jgi:hypothetical protein
VKVVDNELVEAADLRSLKETDVGLKKIVVWRGPLGGFRRCLVVVCVYDLGAQ